MYILQIGFVKGRGKKYGESFRPNDENLQKSDGRKRVNMPA